MDEIKDLYDETIDLYEGLIEELQELNINAPEIKSMYSSFQTEIEQHISSVHATVEKANSEIKKAESAGIKKISELSTAQKNQIDEKLKELNKAAHNADKYQKSLDASVDSIIDFEEQIDEFKNLIDKQEKLIREQAQKCDKLEKHIQRLETRLKEVNNGNSSVKPRQSKKQPEPVLQKTKGAGKSITDRTFHNRLDLFIEQTIKGTETRDTILKQGELFTEKQEKEFNDAKNQALSIRKLIPRYAKIQKERQLDVANEIIKELNDMKGPREERSKLLAIIYINIFCKSF